MFFATYDQKSILFCVLTDGMAGSFCNEHISRAVIVEPVESISSEYPRSGLTREHRRQLCDLF